MIISKIKGGGVIVIIFQYSLSHFDGNAAGNKGFLKDASPELREKIINSRVKSLQGQIDNFQQQITAIKTFKKDILTKD